MTRSNPFVTANQAVLEHYRHMSQTAGSRTDYVQGGGGNTSCKLDSTLMAIKASGFRLDQIDLDQAYAVLDYQALRSFYSQNDPARLDDVEQAGSACARAAIRTFEGLPDLRPSVEAGFHSLLDTYVLHTHAIYANLVTCSVQGRQTAAAALAGLDVCHAYVPYINPGAQLTFAVRQAVAEAEAACGRKPQVIFMQNHGLIVTGPDAQDCLDLHDLVNSRVAAQYGVSAADWPDVGVMAQDGPEDGQFWVSRTPWLKERLLDTPWDLEFFTVQSLYPDQLVFLAGQMDVAEHGPASRFDREQHASKCTIFRETGEVVYRCSRNEAQTIEETLCAILFITRTIRQAGQTVCTMSEAGRQFISGWESEHYRKTITAKG